MTLPAENGASVRGFERNNSFRSVEFREAVQFARVTVENGSFADAIFNDDADFAHSTFD